MTNMDDNSSNSWNTTGGTCMAPSFEELVRTRRADMEKETKSGYKEMDFLPSGGENFAKKQNQLYNWSGDRQPLMRAHPGNYFNDTEESAFKKLSYGGDNKIEMKRTVTKIFNYS